MSVFTISWPTLISKAVADPFERIKILLQVQGELIKSGRLSQPYNGVIDCVQRTIKEEGIFSLWNGLLPQIWRTIITDQFNSHLSGIAKKLIPNRKGYWKSYLSGIASGGLAGTFSLLFVYPLDFANTRLNADIVQSAQGGTRQYANIQDLFSKTIASDGISGIYRGFPISVLGIVAYRALYFGLYDFLNPLLMKIQKKPSYLSKFLMAWVITIASGFITYPLDTVRRRQMMTVGESFKYNNFWSAFSEITAKEGVTALWNGAFMNIVRAIVAAGALTVCDYISPPNTNQKH